MKLVNVRLGPADVAKVRALRAQGAELSEIVRRAIDAEYVRRVKEKTVEDVAGALERIYEACPEPAGTPPERIDALDRRALRREATRRIRRGSARSRAKRG